MPKKVFEHSESHDAIKQRVRWAINYAADTHGITNEKLGKVIGVSTSAINSYRRMKTLPNFEFFIIFSGKYQFSMDWFTIGKGEPFPGARMRYPDVCGPEPAPLYNKDTIAELPAGDAQKLNVDEAMGKTYKVLSSGSPYAVALYLNVQQFSNAVDAAQELRACHDLITGLQSQMDDLRRQVNRLTAPPTTAEQQETSLQKEAM